jgi:hypothetical protein
MKCRSCKTLQGQNVTIVKITADESLGGGTMRVKMSRGHFVGGRFIKAPKKVEHLGNLQVIFKVALDYEKVD